MAALVSAGITFASGAGLLRRRSVVRRIEERRRSFVEGLPAFGQGPAQGASIAALDRFAATRDGLEALASASPHLDLPRFTGASSGPEAELLALAEHFVQDARTSLGLVCDAGQARALLEADPGIFQALHERGPEALASRTSVAQMRAKITERHEASCARLARLESASAFAPGSIEDRVTTMAHASALGALGAKVGAAVGTLVLPGVGTLLGTAIGGLAAGVGGATAARELDKEGRAAHARARGELAHALAVEVPASAKRALEAVRAVDREQRALLSVARARATAKRPRPPELRAVTNDLLRALSWRLDEGGSLLASEGALLGHAGASAWTRAVKAKEETHAREALASKRRSHARATEALKSALREEDALAALGWIVAVPLPSHPEVDELFEALATLVTRLVDDEAAALAAERKSLVDAWTRAIVEVDRALEAELARHAAVRNAIVARHS